MSVYSRLASLASTYGSSDVAQVAGAAARGQAAVTRFGQQAQRTANALTSGGRTAVRGRAPRSRGTSYQGLPGVEGVRGAMGSTTVHRRPLQQPYADVAGLPQVRMAEGDNHSVIITISLRSRYADWMTEGDLAELRWLAARIERDMRRLSRGRLRPKQLAKMNHPYGHGLYAKSEIYRDARGKMRVKRRRRKALPKALAPKRFRQLGVTSMDVVNRDTGLFERSWESDAEWTRAGAVIVIRNTAPYASRLAFGTPLMKAHGPWTAVIVLHRSRISLSWRNIGHRAWRRSNA